jgi:hypothetical protein
MNDNIVRHWIFPPSHVCWLPEYPNKGALFGVFLSRMHIQRVFLVHASSILFLLTVGNQKLRIGMGGGHL